MTIIDILRSYALASDLALTGKIVKKEMVWLDCKEVAFAFCYFISQLELLFLFFWMCVIFYALFDCTILLGSLQVVLL